MPDTAMDTEYDLRDPEHRAEFDEAVDAFIKAQGKSDFTARELA